MLGCDTVIVCCVTQLLYHTGTYISQVNSYIQIRVRVPTGRNAPFLDGTVM